MIHQVSWMPLLFYMHYRIVPFDVEGFPPITLTCDLIYSNFVGFSYGGYYQNVDERCITFEVDEKCDELYSCANVHSKILDYTWYGSKARVCLGINLKKKYIYIEEQNTSIGLELDVRCFGPGHLVFKVYSNVRFFKIYDLYLPMNYREYLVNDDNLREFKIDSKWVHFEAVKIPRYDVVMRLKNTVAYYPSFLFLDFGNYKYTYSCDGDSRANISLDKPDCGKLLPINLTHGVCFNSVFIHNRDRCFDDYKIKFLVDEYKYNKFINQKPGGLVGLIVNEVIDGILYLVKPIIEAVVYTLIRLLVRVLEVFRDVLNDLMPEFVKLLNEVLYLFIDLVEDIIELFRLVVKFLGLLYEKINESLIIFEIFVLFLGLGFIFGLFRGLICIILILYFVGFYREDNILNFC